MLNSLGLENISSSTIITIENSATQIDFSCSGIKGLWSGLIFYFSITWLDKLKINLNWLITFVLLIITILSANILRIFIIVLLGSVYKQAELAEIIHAPLGIIGFVFSCLLIYYFIKSKLFKKELIQFNISSILLKKLDSFKMKKYNNLNWSRYLIILLLGISIFIPKEKSIEINKVDNLNFPSDWVTNSLDLTEEEVAFFENQGSLATKIAFQANNISGSLLLVNSNGWRGHHNPEYCMRAGGNLINKIETVIIADNFPIKWLNVNKESSACYWFQSPTECTDDFGTRVWSELRTKENDWILVSVVFNNFQNIDTKEINEFILTINRLIKEQKEHKNTLLNSVSKKTHFLKVLSQKSSSSRLAKC